MIMGQSVDVGIISSAIIVDTTDIAGSEANSSSYAFVGLDIGANNNGGRQVIAGYSVRAALSTPEFYALTINGVSATRVAYVRDETGGYLTETGICIVDLDTSDTEASVQVDFSAQCSRAGVALWSCSGGIDAVPTAISSSLDDPAVLDIDTEDKGLVTAMVYDNDGDGFDSIFTGVVKDNQSTRWSSAHTVVDGAETPRNVSVDVNSATYAASVAVSWALS